MRGPRTAMKSSPHLPQLEKALAQKRRPNTAKKKERKVMCLNKYTLKKKKKRTSKAVISLIVTIVSFTTKALSWSSPRCQCLLTRPCRSRMEAQGRQDDQPACGRPRGDDGRNPALKDSPLSLVEPRNPPLGKARKMASGTKRGHFTSRCGRTFDVSFPTFQCAGRKEFCPQGSGR